MALAGDLAEFGIVDIIQLIDLGKKTGGVEIHGRRGSNQFDGWIYFNEGKICAAQIGNLQGEEAAYTFFTCTAGQFQLHEQAPIPAPNVRVSNEVIIMEGIGRQDEWETLEQRAPNPEMILRLVANPRASSREFNLEANKWRVLTMINGKNTVGEIVRLSGLGEFAALKIVIELLDAGLVEGRIEEKRVDPVYPDLERMAVAGIGNSARVLLSDAFRRVGIRPDDPTTPPQQMLKAITAFEQSTTLLLGPSRARLLADQLRTRVQQPTS